MKRQTAVISFDDYVTAVWKPRHEAFAQGDPRIYIGPHKTMLFGFHGAQSTLNWEFILGGNCLVIHQETECGLLGSSMVAGMQSKSDECINVMLATTEVAATASTKVKREEEAKTRAEITPVEPLMERGSQKPSSLTGSHQLLQTPGETLHGHSGHRKKVRLLQFLLGCLLGFCLQQVTLER